MTTLITAKLPFYIVQLTTSLHTNHRKGYVVAWSIPLRAILLWMFNLYRIRTGLHAIIMWSIYEEVIFYMIQIILYIWCTLNKFMVEIRNLGMSEANSIEQVCSGAVSEELGSK